LPEVHRAIGANRFVIFAQTVRYPVSAVCPAFRQTVPSVKTVRSCANLGVLIFLKEMLPAPDDSSSKGWRKTSWPS